VKRIVLAAALLVTAFFNVWGAGLEVFTDVRESYAGQPVKLTVRIVSDTQISRPVLPVLEGFTVQEAGESLYDERIRGTGGSSRKITAEYGWILIPEKTGVFTIPPLVIQAGSERLSSEPVTLTIREPGPIEGYHLFLTSTGDKAFPRIPVRITLKWLFSSEVSRPDFVLPFLRTSGIRIIDLPPPSSNTADIYKFTVDGHTIYAVQSAEIYEGRQYASLSMSWDMVAEESGSLSLDPVLLSFQRSVMTQSGRKGYENAVIPSNPLKLEIRKLPAELESFPGGILVADTGLTISASLDQNRIYPGDPLELTLRFQGLNNPELTDFRGIGGMPEIAGIISADKAEISSEAADSQKIVRQKIRFVSSSPGEFPALTFPFFNMETGQVDYCRTLPVPVTLQRLDDNKDSEPDVAVTSQIKPADEPVSSAILGNVSGIAEDRHITGFLYSYALPLSLLFLLLCLILMIPPGIIRGVGSIIADRSSMPVQQLVKSLELYEKNPDRKLAHQLYDQFWVWIRSLTGDKGNINQAEMLRILGGKLNPSLLEELNDLARFLDSFWMPGTSIPWCSTFTKVPAKVQKAVNRKGQR